MTRFAIPLMICAMACAVRAGTRPSMPLIVNEPAEHFFVSTAKSLVLETEGKPNAFTSLWDFRFPKDVTCTEQGAERYVDALAGGNLTHLFINVNYQRAFYPSKVFEPIWVSLDEPGRQKQPFIRGMKEAFDRGLDVYAVLMRRCREKGVSPWLSFRMNDIHGSQTGADPMVSTFWKEHPEWHLNKDEGWANGLDYAEKAVRDRMVALIREAVARYDADGVELDLIRFPFYFRAGTERANAPFLTEVVRAVRGICDETARRRGHPMKIAVRLLPDPKRAEKMGADVGLWAREGLVDAVIACNMYGSIEYDYPLGDWRKLLGGKVRLVAGTDNGIVENGARRILNLGEYRHWIDLMLKGGADGFYFFNFPLRPYRDETWRGILGEDGPGPERAKGPMRVALTFDDALKDHLLIAAPLLEKHGWRGTFNIVTDWVGKDERHLTWEDVRELARRGHEIATHTASHRAMVPLLAKSGEAAVRGELARSRDAIAAQAGVTPRYYCAPGVNQDMDTAYIARKEGLEQMSVPRRNFGTDEEGRTREVLAGFYTNDVVRLDLLHHGISQADHGGHKPFSTAAAFAAHLEAIAALEREGRLVVTDYGKMKGTEVLGK